jgi:hypothetical protein
MYRYDGTTLHHAAVFNYPQPLLDALSPQYCNGIRWRPTLSTLQSLSKSPRQWVSIARMILMRDDLLHHLASLGNKTLPVHSIMAAELIRAGADVNCRTVLGWTPIHMIAMQGQKEATQLAKGLIALGADLTAVDKYGADWKMHWQHGTEIRDVLEAAPAENNQIRYSSGQPERTPVVGPDVTPLQGQNPLPVDASPSLITGAMRWTGYSLIALGLLFFASTYIAT